MLESFHDVVHGESLVVVLGRVHPLQALPDVPDVHLLRAGLVHHDPGVADDLRKLVLVLVVF